MSKKLQSQKFEKSNFAKNFKSINGENRCRYLPVFFCRKNNWGTGILYLTFEAPHFKICFLKVDYASSLCFYSQPFLNELFYDGPVSLESL